jgi:hypothetical protein
MPANKFVLTGSGVTVDYTIGANPSFAALLYKQGAFQRDFTPAQITTDDTGLGQLTSVSLLLTPDVGRERFGFFLPFIEVPRGKQRTSTLWEFMKPSAVPIPFRIGLPLGVSLR